MSVDPSGLNTVNTSALEGCPIEPPDGGGTHVSSVEIARQRGHISTIGKRIALWLSGGHGTFEKRFPLVQRLRYKRVTSRQLANASLLWLSGGHGTFEKRIPLVQRESAARSRAEMRPTTLRTIVGIVLFPGLV
jgi:hypothetical protein